MRAAFADVAVTADDRDLAGDHDIERAVQAVDERMAAAIKIIELRFGDGVVDVDRRNEQLIVLLHLVEPMHAGRRLFRNAAPFLDHLVPAIRIFALHFEKQILDHLLFLARRRRFRPLAAFFQLVAFVNEKRHVAAVIDDQLRTFAVRERDRLVGAPPIFLEALALPGEDRHACLGDRGRRMILGRKNIAARPAHLRAERDQRLDQHRGLDRHVQRTGHAHAGERFARRVFFADRHQSRHFLFRDGDFLAAPIGQS